MVQLFRPVQTNVDKQTEILRDIQGKKAPLPVTGTPVTEGTIVRAISSKTLSEQGAPAGKIAIALESERKERERKKTRGFQANGGIYNMANKDMDGVSTPFIDEIANPAHFPKR